MYKIEYEIKLNDSGRPCIDLPVDYENQPEDRFFALEMSRYILQRTHSRMTAPPYDQNTIDMMDISIRLLGQVGDEIAKLLYEQMESMGEISMTVNNRYHIKVNSIEERDALPEKVILYDGKIFNRIEGLKVYVQSYDEYTFLPVYKIYELKDGIGNENWVEVIKIDNEF